MIVPDELSGTVESLLTGPIGVSAASSTDLATALRQAGRRSPPPSGRTGTSCTTPTFRGKGSSACWNRTSRMPSPTHFSHRSARGLVETVRAYVAANGQGEAAARALGVHRHTLRARMRKATELLGRDPDDPAVRAELWIALAITSNRGDQIGQHGDSKSGPPGLA